MSAAAAARFRNLLNGTMWGRYRVARLNLVLDRALTEHNVRQFMQQCKNAARAAILAVDNHNRQGLLRDGEAAHFFKVNLMMRAAQHKDQDAGLFDGIAPGAKGLVGFAPAGLLREYDTESVSNSMADLLRVVGVMCRNPEADGLFAECVQEVKRNQSALVSGAHFISQLRAKATIGHAR